MKILHLMMINRFSMEVEGYKIKKIIKNINVMGSITALKGVKHMIKFLSIKKTLCIEHPKPLIIQIIH